jgi:hypothetical protein
MGNSEDVFLQSVNVFTEPPLTVPRRPPSLFYLPSFIALKLFECCSYAAHSDFAELLGPLDLVGWAIPRGCMIAHGPGLCEPIFRWAQIREIPLSKARPQRRWCKDQARQPRFQTP